MGERWIARGPDDFGDFTISAEGEKLAKCVVVQNGFRSPEETKAISERLIKAVNNHDALVDALRDCADALRSCYQVADFPANGTSSQDHALALAEMVLGAVGTPSGGGK